MFRLIAFDLDGTLLDDNKRISEKTLEVLNRLADKGICLVPATGRPLCGIVEDLKKLRGISYIITCNGGGIYDWETRECVYDDCIPLDLYLPLLEELDKLEIMTDSFLQGKAYMTAWKYALIDRMDISEEMKEYIRTSRTSVENQVKALRDNGAPIEKLTLNFVVDEKGERVDWDKAKEILSHYKGINPVSGGMNNIEVTKEGVSKASGLSWLGEKLGICAEEMMAFGDSGNDVDMIQYAGLGVAMENGEHLAKDVADEIAPKNTQSGVAAVLEKYEKRGEFYEI